MNLISCPLACVRHARVRNPGFGLRQERFRVNAANALSTKFARSRCMPFLSTFKKEKKQDDPSLPGCVCPVSRLRISGRIPNILVQWCVLSAGVGSRRCARIEGERHADQPRSLSQRCWRRRRRCPRRSFEGNGFDVFTMSVQGMLLLPNMSLHSEV